MYSWVTNRGVYRVDLQLKILSRSQALNGSRMIGFHLVIANSEQDMSGMEPGPLGWHTSTLITELQEVRYNTF